MKNDGERFGLNITYQSLRSEIKPRKLFTIENREKNVEKYLCGR
jgi:hypothetical protein